MFDAFAYRPHPHNRRLFAGKPFTTALDEAKSMLTLASSTPPCCFSQLCLPQREDSPPPPQERVSPNILVEYAYVPVRSHSPLSSSPQTDSPPSPAYPMDLEEETEKGSDSPPTPPLTTQERTMQEAQEAQEEAMDTRSTQEEVEQEEVVSRADVVPSPPQPIAPPPQPTRAEHASPLLEGWVNIPSLPPRHILVFDTETTGLAGSVIQLAYSLWEEDSSCKEGGKVVEEKCWYLKTEEVIQPSAKAVHGIDSSVLEEKGEDPRRVLSDFADVIRREKERDNVRFVAHNASFDVGRLEHTLRVLDLSFPLLRKGEVFCTMQHLRSKIGAKNRLGRLKNPSNEETFHRLFGHPPPFSLHDALNDVKVTLLSYLEAERRGWINKSPLFPLMAN